MDEAGLHLQPRTSCCCALGEELEDRGEALERLRGYVMEIQGRGGGGGKQAGGEEAEKEK